MPHGFTTYVHGLVHSCHLRRSLHCNISGLCLTGRHGSNAGGPCLMAFLLGLGVMSGVCLLIRCTWSTGDGPRLAARLSGPVVHKQSTSCLESAPQQHLEKVDTNRVHASSVLKLTQAHDGSSRHSCNTGGLCPRGKHGCRTRGHHCMLGRCRCSTEGGPHPAARLSRPAVRNKRKACMPGFSTTTTLGASRCYELAQTT